MSTLLRSSVVLCLQTVQIAFQMKTGFGQVLDRFCLPTCMTKTEIHHNYVENMRDAGVKEISMPTFSRMWRKNLILKVQF